MTKKNLIIVIILLTIIDLVAAGWYMSRRIEASGKSQDLFDQRDSTDVVAMADTLITSSQPDVFDKLQHNTYYFISNSPAIAGDESTYYTSTKHVKVMWPKAVNGNDDLEELNKELIRKAFDNSQSQMKDARYLYLNSPSFNKPLDDDEYHTQVKAPRVHPVYGNVSQVMVYPYMTSLRLLVMKVDKQEYNGSTTVENSTTIHYDRQTQRVLSRVDILLTDMDKESKLLKLINGKIDDLNKGRGDDRRLQHALNVPADICCSKTGILFQFKHGAIANSPVEIQLDYDKLKPFMTKDFEQLVDNNGQYKLYKDIPKAEPINQASRVDKPKPATAVSASDNKSTSYGKSYKKSYRKNYRRSYRNGYKRSYRNGYGKGSYKGSRSSVKQGQTSRKKYSGAKRRFGHYGRAGRGHWSHRQR